MKNLLIHINGPSYEWQKEVEPLIKIQLDIAQLFWKREDTMLVTNFPYEYNGIKSIGLPDSCYCATKPTVTKVLAILELFNRGLIGDDIYWFHDLDAFQLAPVIVDLKKDMALTDYGITTIRESYNQRWSTGSWFFRQSARLLFEMIKERSLNENINEETALGRLIKDHPSLREMIEKVDISYNFATRKRNLEETYEIAEKPLRVIHFHPLDSRLENGQTQMERARPYIPDDIFAIIEKNL